MPELIKIYWRDIPSQVTAKAGRKTAKVMLPSRFQEAIDRAAMRAGKGSSDAYMEDWRRERSPCSGDLQAEADAAAAELVASLDEDTLEALTKVKGIAAHLGLSREQIRQLEQTAASADAASDKPMADEALTAANAQSGTAVASDECRAAEPAAAPHPGKGS